MPDAAHNYDVILILLSQNDNGIIAKTILFFVKIHFQVWIDVLKLGNLGFTDSGVVLSVFSGKKIFANKLYC